MAKWLKVTTIISEYANYNMFIKVENIIRLYSIHGGVRICLNYEMYSGENYIDYIDVSQSLCELIDQIEGKE
jgi:hypothetical protein